MTLKGTEPLHLLELAGYHISCFCGLVCLAFLSNIVCPCVLQLSCS